MVAGCDAVIGWNTPARFRRVCPLLTQDPAGRWVCGVRTEEVRPFWGRVIVGVGGIAVLLVLLSGLALFGTMRRVGYQVTLRQIFWPRAWSELGPVRERFFIEQAKEYYATGKTREAVSALSVAFAMNPKNYATGMILAQFYQTGRPDWVDGLYRDLWRQHPGRRNEIAQAWFRSLLARGRLAGVAELARQQLALDPDQAAVWTHALIFSARRLQQPALLETAAQEKTVRPEIRAVLELEEKLRRTAPAEACAWLLSQPLSGTFPYARLQRVERLIEFGGTTEALELLRQAPGELSARDVVRLALAAYAVAHDGPALQHEAGLLLAPDYRGGAAGVSLVALHLIKYPDAKILVQCVAALRRLPAEPAEAHREALVATFCAVASAADRELLPGLQREMVKAGYLRAPEAVELVRLFQLKPQDRPLESLLALIRPMSLELNYAILERYFLLKSPPNAPLK